eukprot:COSAG06_NODE_6808_length_2767_cov_63.616567_4_plen_92_part_00
MLVCKPKDLNRDWSPCFSTLSDKHGFDDATDLITTLSVDAANVLNLVVAPAVGNPESPGGGWPRLHARLEGVVLYDMRSMQRRYLHGMLPP